MSRRLRGDPARAAHGQATVTLQVPFHDVDAAHVVWHGHYVKYFEIARSTLLDDLGFGHARMLASDYYWPVVTMNARYVQPLRLDQHFDVTAYLMEYELRLRVRYEVCDAGSRERVASGETIQVAVRRSDGMLCIGLPEEFPPGPLVNPRLRVRLLQPAWRTRAMCISLLVLFASLLPAATAFAAPARTAAATLPAPLQSLARAIRGAPMRCVPFEQRKHIASLQRELTFRGEMTVTEDRRVHWRLQSPLRAEYQFLADGAWRRSGTAPWARLAVPDAASRVIHDMLAALLDLDPVALTRQFDLRVTGTSPLVFDAVPKDARLRRVIAKVTVQGEQRIDRLRVLEASGNWSDYTFTPPAASAACDVPPPPNG